MIEDATETAQEPGWTCARCQRWNALSVEYCLACGGDGRSAQRSERGSNTPASEWQPPSRFPSPPETRRAILNDFASANTKYARPFEQGSVARVSLVGTELG